MNIVKNVVKYIQIIIDDADHVKFNIKWFKLD